MARKAAYRMGWNRREGKGREEQLKYLWIKKPLFYSGEQLKSHFAYLEHGLLGDSIVAFRGPCDVSFEKMVDGEDFLQKAAIRGSDMLHFIIESFGSSLITAVSNQRLFASLFRDQLREAAVKKLGVSLVGKKDFLFRMGDDLYWGKRKLSISIATVSPVSSLIHFAANLSNEGTPVPTCALPEFGIGRDEKSIKNFAEKVMIEWVNETQTMLEATQKVKWVP